MLVLTAGRSDLPACRQALESLCQTYWFPLYAYLRRRGYDKHQAEESTQAFFAHLLEKHELQSVDPAKGRFRAFLLLSQP